jgi:hypothetical protein
VLHPPIESAQPGPFTVQMTADVMTVDQLDQNPGAPFVEIKFLPDALPGFLLPSRFCASDRFGQMATSITAC